MLGDRPFNEAGVFRPHVVAARKIKVSVAEYEAQRAAGNAWCSLGRHWAAAGEFGRTKLGRRDRYCTGCKRDRKRS